MGTGASKHGHARRKVQAVKAFEDAGKRHKKKSTASSTKSNSSRKSGSISSEKDPQQVESPRSNWAKVRERTVLRHELDTTSNLKLSDFNKVVRKKALEKEDEEPVEIPYGCKAKVEPEELCHVCSVYTGRETYPCRICYKVYHEGCLRKLGQCSDPASSVLLRRALKPVGWSCHECDDLSNLLTQEELFQLYESLDRHQITQDTSVSLEEYLDYRRRVHKEEQNDDMSQAKIQEETARFHKVDRDNTGSITWWEFINYESINVLQRRSKNSILKLLTLREIELSRILFRAFDENLTGFITEYSARKAIASFYTLFLERDDAFNGFAIMNLNKQDELAFVLNETLSFTMDNDPDEDRKMGWRDFLWELCIYVLAARPNLSPVPVEGSEWTKGVVVSTEMDCDLKRTSL
ncbi:hypothetical protein FSP39_022535 [Pinctada imbricata]|uniref:KIAA1045 RING finger domain-containing protein n=1 Tax=Pinctada imbricata TaxID=66713 RepID=A0AA88YGB6_PINIB|nr:hypothetical protein FSP39_022535 [Pinctada imbricata]